MLNSAFPVITRFATADLMANRAALSELLHACVHDGASIGFVLPFSLSDADEFWRDKISPQLEKGHLILLVAQMGDGHIAGAVQLDCDTPKNQPHRAEVRKLLVHPRYRRRGIARHLMAEVENIAQQQKRVLLTLDTRTGDNAQILYESLGYHVAGSVPQYCLDTMSTRRDATTIMFKAL